MRCKDKLMGKQRVINLIAAEALAGQDASHGVLQHSSSLSGSGKRETGLGVLSSCLSVSGAFLLARAPRISLSMMTNHAVTHPVGGSSG